MKSSSRILSVILVLVMTLSVMVSCGEAPAETTAPETTLAPTTTAAPTTTVEPVTTLAPTTEAPATEAPATEAPATESPATEAPATEAPATEAPATEAPATEAPATEAPATEAPATEAPATEAPATEAPAPKYNISYDLDGGYCDSNPTVYSEAEEAVISKRPVKPGYDFVGWTGDGITEPVKTVTIAKGTTGDIELKANWAEDTNTISPDQVDDSNNGKDDGLVAKEGEIPVSVHDMLGGRGEGIYLLKTVYTDVIIDGIMDPAYTYGLHFKGDVLSNLNFYDTREPATFDVYMIRGQDGLIKMYVEVTDPEVVVNSHIFSTLGLPYHCDSLDFYYEYGNLGSGHEMYEFIGDETGKFKRRMPENTKILLSDTGYIIETTFDNDGKPFAEYDELGFGFYLNETRDWNEETKEYSKNLIKNHSLLNPVGTTYKSPSAAIHDAVMATAQSATGAVDVSSSIPEKSGDMLTDILNGSASVLVTYDQYATAQTIIAAQNLKNIISGKGGNVKIKPEEGVGEITFDYEILLGKTTRDASKALVASLEYNEYAVALNDTSIALVGWNQENAESAYNILCEMFEDVIFNGAKTEDFGSLYKGVNTDLMSSPALKLEGFDSITDVGENAYLIYKLEATMEEYEAYCAQLVEGGYTLYTTNTMVKVYCATYYNEDTVINVLFSDGGRKTMKNPNPDHSFRIVVEPMSNTKLPALEKPEDADAKITDTTFTQMYPHNLCDVIQLSNGHFIVIDSGNNGTQKDLSKFLCDMAPDGRPIVDAWIFTHFHQDHIGGFIDYMGASSLTRYITVKNVIYNFPQWQVLNTASGNDINNLRLFYELRKPALEEKGTEFYQARTGQKYYFGNAEIEILWTFEDIMPTNIFVDSTNQTDIGFMITIEGQKILITGDTSENEFRVAASRYGNYLKCDMLQLAHHGGGNGMGEHNVYVLADAPIVFHPNPKTSGYPGSGGNEKWAVNNAELVIRSGNYGIATLKLPFKIGDDIISTMEPKDELGK